VIEAVRGRNYLADIALDDILYTDGPCGQEGIYVYIVFDNLGCKTIPLIDCHDYMY